MEIRSGAANPKSDVAQSGHYFSDAVTNIKKNILKYEKNILNININEILKIINWLLVSNTNIKMYLVLI